MNCPICGSQIEDGGKFCSQCGAPVQRSVYDEQVEQAVLEPGSPLEGPVSAKKRPGKVFWIVSSALVLVILLFIFILQPMILHRQMQGTWYQKVYDKNDTSYLLKLEIDGDTIDYIFCYEDLFGNDRESSINGAKRYQVGLFGNVKIYRGTTSHSASDNRVFVWGDGMTLSPSFGGEGCGEEWSRFSDGAHFFTEELENEILRDIGSSKPETASSKTVSEEPIDLETAIFSDLTTDQFIKRINDSQFENIGRLSVLKTTQPSSKVTTYTMAGSEDIVVNVFSNPETDKCRFINVESSSQLSEACMIDFLTACDPKLLPQVTSQVVGRVVDPEAGKLSTSCGTCVLSNEKNSDSQWTFSIISFHAYS